MDRQCWSRDPDVLDLRPQSNPQRLFLSTRLLPLVAPHRDRRELLLPRTMDRIFVRDPRAGNQPGLSGAPPRVHAGFFTLDAPEKHSQVSTLRPHLAAS